MTIALTLRVTGPQPSAVAPIPAEATWTNTGEADIALHPWLQANGPSAQHSTVFRLRAIQASDPLIVAAGARHTAPCEIVVPPTLLHEDEAATDLSVHFEVRVYTKPVEALGDPNGQDFDLVPVPIDIDIPVRRNGIAWLDTDYGTRSRFFCHEGAVYYARSDDLPALLDKAAVADARAVTCSILVSNGKLFWSRHSAKRQPKGEITGLSDVFYRAGDTIMTTYGNAKVADPATFEAIGPGERSLYMKDDYGYRCGYGRDATQAYYFCESTSPTKSNVVRTCKSPETLEPLGYCFARDTTSVYLEGKRIAKADGPSFRLLNAGFGQDKRGIWFNDTFLDDVHAETFELIPDSRSLRDPDPLAHTSWGRDAKGLIHSFGRATEDDYAKEMARRRDR